MSKINAVRLININYNNNAIRINDETFHFNGESTLMSLRNGGGKSVLVQMMTAPFVHKRYRDAKDRPFESYFTSAKPSFILTEWALDQGAGYVLVGMMVRKSQDAQEDSLENLEMVNFISEYRSGCAWDIHHLPVVEKRGRELTLKNFAACRQLFDGYKKESTMKFFHYDMANGAQSRQYFSKLSEYQINYKEWEGIIKKVNLKESGLSELFADCRDEKGLVEKWFLDAVENKLNKDKNRMIEFQGILEKYVGQYKDNQSKIKRRDAIRLFQEQAVRIGEKNQRYLECGISVGEQVNRIACFREKLEELQQGAEKEEQENQMQIEAVRQETACLVYEKLSEEYYALGDDKKLRASNRDMTGMEKEDLERDLERISEKLHLLACAKQQETVDEEKSDWEQACQRLAVAKERNEDLEPERNRLGGLLHAHYRVKLEESEKDLERNQTGIQEMSEQIAREQETLKDLEEALQKNSLSLGELKSQIRIYDDLEEKFNRSYQEDLKRNILGEYEPGSMDIFAKNCRHSLERVLGRRTVQSRALELAENRKNSLEHSILEKKDEKTHAIARLNQQKELEEEYEQELSKRRAVLKYLELGEDVLFQEEKIFQASWRKLKEIESVRRNLEKEGNDLQKEYRKLTEGKVLELPQELEAEFESLGIHTVYGMEWLKRNGYSEKKNHELVKRHPFLPYALILSEGEVEKLSKSCGSIPTAFPIPIILRKDLEEKAAAEEGKIFHFSGISFYLLFNEMLLDEEKLQQLVEQKRRQIEKNQEVISVKEKEYEEYFAWKELVRNQRVRKVKYEENKEDIRRLTGQINALDLEIRQTSQEVSELKEQVMALDKEIRSIDKEIEALRRKEGDFAELCKAYEEYKENCRRREKCRKEEVRLEECRKLAHSKVKKFGEKQQSLQNERNILEREKERQIKQLEFYRNYQEILKEEADLGISVSEMEARYTAVTATVSGELREIEGQELKSGRRYRQAKEELLHLAGKYRLAVGAWNGILYSRKEEGDQEIRLEDRTKKIKAKEILWNEEDKKVALLGQKMQERLKRMEDECGQKQPLPRGEIRQEDFQARRNELDDRRRELEDIGKRMQERLSSYGENLTALAEYSELKVTEPIEWQENFAGMDTKTLRNFKGILLRDYNKICGDRQEARENLVSLLNQILRMDCFQENFYRKPLEAMLELSGDAGQVQRQLDTTLQSYRSLMEKLEVDISLVEKEKERIAELLEDYVQEVHQNLVKIDQNSTITIRERPVKMLKIGLPSWEENENLYRIRLKDFIDEMTQKGILMFEQNENAQEYFGLRMTTRNLYDTVVGIGNVQIRLYKIEEQREYPITWAEVARNSGGEGFLSAFVVLSSLLYFMRRDDTDIFADRNEGKVLLMDNPFAQTNASHLLKPLMDMAKKTNTQLICFTGLGGESIYNRFDNIYVLNLIAASIRQGMQYLKAEHMRGNDAETVIASRIEVVEQQELIF